MRFYLILFTLCFIWFANSRSNYCQVLGQPAQERVGEQSQFPKLEFRKWSGDINVPDPVAISVDDQGRVYVTQTRRRKIQDLDIRANREWIPDDVGLQTVEQKREFLQRKLAIGGDDVQQAKHVDDHNQDGHHDWRDLTVISEVIYRLVDSNQDGTADRITVFAEDFKTEVTGIAAGVLAYDNAVYATVAPDLWKLRDHNGDGVADSQESIAHGFGIHIAYAGHDMHGPTVGPDGKIYWSIGDKGINVTTADGQNFAYPNQGGVLRCNPDGSDFEVFAHGLRNVQEVAFDQYGNMFGVDNDADQNRERERFVYIVQDMDAGWRCNYQYRGSDYNPWTDEKLWELPGEQHAAYLIPPLAHYIDGPAGFKFNPGTALSPAYKNFFFLTGAPHGVQHAFRVQAEGDAFKMVDEHQIGSGLAIVGLAFGPDGALYGADWDGGYPLDEIGSVVRIDVPGASQSPERLEVKQLLAEGLESKNAVEMLALLDHPDQRIRLAAQFALVKADAGDMLASKALDDNSSTLSRLHAIWGLGQLERAPDLYQSGGTMARDSIGMLLKARDSVVRGQAAKTYGELKRVDGYALVDLLDDEDLHVRTLAGMALGRQPTSLAVEPLLAQADVLTPEQHYLRHSLVCALAACAKSEQLAEQAKHGTELRRMCAVLALRRQGSVSVKDFLHDSSDWVATEAARAIHDDDSIDAALPALASALLERDSQSVAFTVRAINANFRRGDAESAQRVLQYALADRHSGPMRLVAMQALADWLAPSVLDRVEGVRRELPSDVRHIDSAGLNKGLAELAGAAEGGLRAASLAAARRLNVALPAAVLLELATHESNTIDTRIEALNSLTDANSADATLSLEVRAALEAAVSAQQPPLQSRGLELLCQHFPEVGLTRIQSLLANGEAELSVRQTSVSLLPQLPRQQAENVLSGLVQQLADGSLDRGLGLEVYQAVQAFPELAQKAQLSTEKFAYSRDGGDAQRGREIFNSHVAAQCSRCHKVGKEGSEIGPPLTTIAATRDADYLLRAIVAPSADIDDKYRSQMFVLDSGEVIKGMVQSSTDQQTIIADSSGNLRQIDNQSIEETISQTVSLMPEMTEILTAEQVRALVAYLRTLK
jgi:quinoprotein glucose dehydrogenase